MSFQRSEASQREEELLFGRLRAGDAAARDALVRRFVPLARKLARGFRGSEDIDDLEQVAAIGLLKAVDRFDSQRGLAFSTFAVPTIVGELKRHFRDRGWSVRVPRDLQELTLRMERLASELSGELGRSPTVDELAQRAGFSHERVLEAIQAGAARRSVSLDQPYGNVTDPDATGREIAIEEPGYAAVEQAFMLDDLMQVLAPRDREILQQRFLDDRLQWQIADSMGLSQMHVSRVIRTAIEQLQRAANSPLRREPAIRRSLDAEPERLAG